MRPADLRCCPSPPQAPSHDSVLRSSVTMVSKVIIQALLPAVALGAAVRRDVNFDYDSLSLRTVGAPNSLVRRLSQLTPAAE